MGQFDAEYQSCNFQDDAADHVFFKYADRYGALRQDTTFYKNLMKLKRVLAECQSYQEALLRCLAAGIEEPKLKFFILYTWISRARWFKYPEIRELSEIMQAKNMSDDEIRGLCCADVLTYRKLDSMRKTAFANGHAQCCRYAKFVEQAL